MKADDTTGCIENSNYDNLRIVLDTENAGATPAKTRDIAFDIEDFGEGRGFNFMLKDGKVANGTEDYLFVSYLSYEFTCYIDNMTFQESSGNVAMAFSLNNKTDYVQDDDWVCGGSSSVVEVSDD